MENENKQLQAAALSDRIATICHGTDGMVVFMALCEMVGSVAYMGDKDHREAISNVLRSLADSLASLPSYPAGGDDVEV